MLYFMLDFVIFFFHYLSYCFYMFFIKTIIFLILKILYTRPCNFLKDTNIESSKFYTVGYLKWH